MRKSNQIFNTAYLEDAEKYSILINEFERSKEGSKFETVRAQVSEEKSLNIESDEEIQNNFSIDEQENHMTEDDINDYEFLKNYKGLSKNNHYFS